MNGGVPGQGCWMYCTPINTIVCWSQKYCCQVIGSKGNANVALGGWRDHPLGMGMSVLVPMVVPIVVVPMVVVVPAPPHRNFRSPLCPDQSRLGTPDSTSKRFGLFRSPSAHPASSSGCLFLPGETSNWRQTYLRSTPLSSFLCTQPDLTYTFSIRGYLWPESTQRSPHPPKPDQIQTIIYQGEGLVGCC